jgi:cytochrome c oxidase subunit 1
MELSGSTPAYLERWGLWLGLTAALIVVAYAIPIADMLSNPTPGSPGYKTW